MSISNSGPTPADQPDALEALTTRMFGTLDPADVLRTVVDGMVEDLDAALARIWLVAPGDLCDTCHMAALCRDRESCLHIAASAGLSTNLDGEYRRIPYSGAKMGEVAARREGHWTNAVLQDPRVARKDWAREHGLRCFAGHPLEVDDDLFGVIGVFFRRRLTAEDFRRLAVFARQVAIAIRNARLFEQLATPRP